MPQRSMLHSTKGVRMVVPLAALAMFATFGLLSPDFTGPSGGVRTPPPAAHHTNTKEELQLSDDKLGSTQESSPLRVGGAILSLLAALVVALAPVTEPAYAARTGGRIGGTAPSKKAPPRAAPSVTNNTTVIKKETVVVAPPAPPPVVVAPAPVMGMGYGGMGMGMGMAPVVVAPPPTLGEVVAGAVIGGAINGAINSTIPRGPSTTDRMLENQQRQDERQLDKQSMQLEALQRELQDLKNKK